MSGPTIYFLAFRNAVAAAFLNANEYLYQILLIPSGTVVAGLAPARIETYTDEQDLVLPITAYHECMNIL